MLRQARKLSADETTDLTQLEQVWYEGDVSNTEHYNWTRYYALNLHCLIICIDEFTRVDKGLGTTIQPYIAQLIKDTFFRNPNISVKVSSLWNKTEMQRRQLGKDRTGIELGEDIKRGVDLDTMFFDSEYSTMFFENMIMATCQLYSKDPVQGDSDFSEFLIKTLFSDREAFKLLICGSQGVPRIFGNLLIAAIDKRVEKGKPQIDPQIVLNVLLRTIQGMSAGNCPIQKKLLQFLMISFLILRPVLYLYPQRTTRRTEQK